MSTFLQAPSASDGPLIDRLAVSPREAALLLGTGHDTVYKLLATGQIASVRLPRRRLIPVAELRRFLAENATASWEPTSWRAPAAPDGAEAAPEAPEAPETVPPPQ